jgi:protein O-mannosyl-transferase
MTKKKTKKEIKAQKQTVASEPKKNNDLFVKIFFAAIVAVLAYGLYAKSIDYNIVHFDDQKHVVFYQNFNSDVANIPKTFEQTTFGYFYRPVLGISYILDGSRGGLDLSVYHKSNIFYHVLGSILVFILLLQLGYNKYYGLAAAAFFAVLPIFVPAVSWLPGRNDPLIGIFIFLSFLTMILYSKEQGKPISYLYLALHFLFFMTSLMTKEVAVMFPFIGVSYYALVKKDKLVGSDKFMLYAGWIILIIVFLTIRHGIVNTSSAGSEVGLSAVITNLPTIPAIIGKIFLPIKMNGCPQIESTSVISGLIIMIALTAAIFVLKNLNKSKVAFGALWTMLFLLPTLAVIIKETQFEYMEHRAYLPMLGLLIIICEILLSFKVDMKKTTAMVAAGAVILLFAIRTYAYQSKYEDRYTFWGNVEQLHPESYVGPFNVAKGYYEEKKFKKAEEYYLKTLKLDSTHANVYVDISAVFIETNRLDKAQEALLCGVALDPDNASVYTNLGSVYSRKSDWQNALKYYKLSTEKGGNSTGSYYNLGLSYQNLEQYDLAEEAYKKSLKLDPKNYNTTFNFGTLYYKMGNAAKAEEYWIKATLLQPANPLAQQNLVGYYLSVQRYKDALQAANNFKRYGGRLDPNLENELKKIKVK